MKKGAPSRATKAFYDQDPHSVGIAQAAAQADCGSGEAMSTFQTNRCEQSEATCAYAAQALEARELAAAEAHIASCPEC